MAFSFVRSLVKHSIKHVGNALGGGIVPVGDIAYYLYEEWCAASPRPQGTPPPASPPLAEQAAVRAELERVLQDPRAYREQVDSLLLEMAPGATEEVRQATRAYLNQVPGRIQSSLRRPDDPTGRTIPAGLVLRRADELAQLLPARMPRFQPGARPVPGTDLVVQELLGVGGFGEVWKAVHASRPHAAPVALKFCTDEAAARTLRKEVELLDRVSRHGRHHGIVELRYAHLEGDPPCLEYEFIDGGDLAGLIAEMHRGGQATPLQMTRLFYSLAQAVGVAHRIQPPVVHRDLKPANVLTTRAQERVLLKVADFGIGGLAAEQAQRTGETVRNSTLTQSSGSCTPLYASPQQRRGGGPDLRDDVYALGVIWFQMLVGDVTREPPTGGSWKKRLLEQGATQDMVALLERCLEDDASDRPADAEVLAGELMATLKTALAVATPTPVARVIQEVPQAQPAEQWYYTRQGQQEGPIPYDELLARAQNGKIQNSDMVWTARLGSWVQAGTIPGLCPVRPPAPPPVPTTRVIGKVIVNGQLQNGALWFKVTLDNEVLGEARLMSGCDFPFQTTTGDHLLEVVSGGLLLGTKTKTYTLSFRDGGNYRVTLQPKMGFLGMSPGFGDDFQIQKVPGG